MYDKTSAVDSIVAIATASGIGSIGIVRISGPACTEILHRVFRTGNGREPGTWMNRRVTFGYVLDSDGCDLDQCLCLVMLAPQSYTGEDVVEFQCHGGQGVLENTVKTILCAGARLAEPGEFTRRAFENGKIDLTQAEAICEIINAKTKQAAQTVTRQLEGALGDKIKAVKEILMDILVKINAGIDYSDDITDVNHDLILESIRLVRNKMIGIVQSCDRGTLLKEGFRVVITGKPNVGKSSVLNALLGYERAIVTDFAGTTRDIVEERFFSNGVPVFISDTAGLRETNEPIEQVGIDRARKAIKSADMILFVVDGSKDLDEEDNIINNMLDEYRVLTLFNKCDLHSKIDNTRIENFTQGRSYISVSARNNIGIDKVHKHIENIVLKATDSAPGTYGHAIIANTRQMAILSNCLKSLDAANCGMDSGLPLDLVTIDITDSINSLALLTGEHITDEILDNIFKNFCVGK